MRYTASALIFSTIFGEKQKSALNYTWLLQLLEDVESGLEELFDGKLPCKTRSTSRQCCRGPGSGVYVNVSPVEYIIPSLLTNETGTYKNIGI